MIYGQNPIPVSIKKISLKIWRLRDELEWIIQSRLLEAQGESEKIDLADLKKTYQKHLRPPDHHTKPSSPKTFKPDPSSKKSVWILNRSRPSLRQEQLSDGVVALIDLNMDTLSCFCDQSFIKGQTVVVEFQIPQHFFVTGEVVKCYPYDEKKQVISLHRPSLRLRLKWIYLLPGERTMLRRFLRSISLEKTRAKPKKEESGVKP